MAWDEALLRSMPQLRQPVLRLYSWSEPAASFGYFQHYEEVARTTPFRPLVRRPTGGGLVPHAADWTYALVIPAGHDWHKLRAEASYLRLHRWLQAAFELMGIPTNLAPEARHQKPGCCFEGYERHDLLWHGHKIAGAAQRRTREGLLIQGSIQPPVTAWNRHAWHRALSATASQLWPIRWQTFEPPDFVQRLMQELVAVKYGRVEYHRQR
ncbi:MAG: hypothetical protein RMN51_09450 [Verrucomicrobiota bacterium]|nr:hypothetical protein [Limisphaera sp.]MDW8382316.1 hypothetical protein [Verrucomicrobiota bacterium]